MWYETLPDGTSWTNLWYDYILCGECRGIRKTDGLCPSCGAPIPSSEPVSVLAADGKEYPVIMAFAGAEGRYEDWVYLKMLEREWLRPLTEDDLFIEISETHRPSARAIVVLIFWTYFETRIERLFREAFRNLPTFAVEELLGRNEFIGARLERLYKIVFSTTYKKDLEELGFAQIAILLSRIQQKRNEFMHGHPEAIDDTLVRDLVASLKDEYESWIAVFNRRATCRPPSTPRHSLKPE
jgi:hypothetical protein